MDRIECSQVKRDPARELHQEFARRANYQERLDPGQGQERFLGTLVALLRGTPKPRERAYIGQRAVLFQVSPDSLRSQCALVGVAKHLQKRK